MGYGVSSVLFSSISGTGAAQLGREITVNGCGWPHFSVGESFSLGQAMRQYLFTLDVKGHIMSGSCSNADGWDGGDMGFVATGGCRWYIFLG